MDWRFISIIWRQFIYLIIYFELIFHFIYLIVVLTPSQHSRIFNLYDSIMVRENQDSPVGETHEYPKVGRRPFQKLYPEMSWTPTPNDRIVE